MLVRDAMAESPVTASPDMNAEDATGLTLANDAGAIPIDPSLGSSKIEQDGLAQGVTLYVRNRLARSFDERGLAARGASALILGASCKLNVGHRESPSLKLMGHLQRGCNPLRPRPGSGSPIPRLSFDAGNAYGSDPGATVERLRR